MPYYKFGSLIYNNFLIIFTIMQKRKLYIILVLVNFIIVFSIANVCQSCYKGMTETAEQVGRQTVKVISKVTEEGKTVGESNKEVTWVDEEGNPIGKEEGSSQPENIDNLGESVEKAINVQLKGKVNTPVPGEITIIIDFETNTVEGYVKGCGWNEEVMTGIKEENSEDHHHTKSCDVVFNGSIWGTIDESGRIIANVIGYLNGKEGECSELIKNKKDSYILDGNYWSTSNSAGGFFEDYMWEANKI